MGCSRLGEVLRVVYVLDRGSDFGGKAADRYCSGEGEAFIQNDILEEILHKEEKKRVWDAVNRLKGQKKEVILLQYFGDFSQKEIAAMLKITPGNVKVLSYRAKKEEGR